MTAWPNIVRELSENAEAVTITRTLINKIASLIDLTRLNEKDTEKDIVYLTDQAYSPFGDVAAVCVYPRFIRIAVRELMGSEIRVATVLNFPEGNDPLEKVISDIHYVIQAGAHEIDLVFPYQQYLSGNRSYGQTFIAACKAACSKHIPIKVIIEAGALIKPEMITDICYDAIDNGADFIKTSTGKIKQGATLPIAAMILSVIKDISPTLKHPVGIKISGGINDVQQAAQYLKLAEHIMGKHWAMPDTFRFGTSRLLAEMVKYY